MHNSVPISKRFFFQIATLTVLALLIHAIVLSFIFPGYYSPLYPHHSDFYISVALAHSPNDFFQYRYLGYSRPMGIFFIKWIGFLGIHGAIFVTVINVAVNAGLSAILVSRILGIEFNWKLLVGFCTYCYLLFSQSYFYTFYTQDVLSHLSYFFLIISVCIFYKFHSRSKIFVYIILFVLSVIAFLCKETYTLSAIFLAFFYFLYYREEEPILIAIAPILLIAGAIICVMLINISIKSVFINLKTSSLTDPYYVNLTPTSIGKEIFTYLHEGLNFLNWIVLSGLVIVAIIYSQQPDKKISYVIFGCIIAAFLSWVPNCLIPNHHNGGYSFNGMYLLYLPIIFILSLQEKRFVSYAIPILLLAALISPIFNRVEYAKQWWVLEQENTQRNILHSLDTLMNGIKHEKTNQRILVTGLTMPFYPFHHPRFLKEYKNSGFADYDVIIYSGKTDSERLDGVKFIAKPDVRIDQYDAIWMFNSTGLLLKALLLDSLNYRLITNNNLQDCILNPDSTKNQILLSFIK